MKITFWFLLTVACLNTFAQDNNFKINLSTEEKTSGTLIAEVINLVSGKNILVGYSHSGLKLKTTLYKFNQNLEKEQSIDFKDLFDSVKDEIVFQKIEYFNDKLILIFFSRNKDTKIDTYYYQLLDENTLSLIDSPIKLYELEYDKYIYTSENMNKISTLTEFYLTFRSGDLVQSNTLFKSSDEKILANVQLYVDLLKPNLINVSVLNEDLKIIWKKENIELPAYPYDAYKIKVSNKGDIYIGCTIDDQYKIIAILNNGNEIKEFEIKEDKILTDYYFEISDDKKLDFYSFYSSVNLPYKSETVLTPLKSYFIPRPFSNDYGANGIMTFNINLSNGSIENQIIEPFSEELMVQDLKKSEAETTKEKIAAGNPVDLPQFKMKKVITNPNNTKTVFSEQHWTTSGTNYQLLGTFEDLIVFNLDSINKINWCLKFERKLITYTQNLCSNMSFLAVPSTDKVYLLYNAFPADLSEIKRNLGKGVIEHNLLTIMFDGTFTNTIMGDDKTNQSSLNTKFGEIDLNNNLITTYYTKKSFQLAKIKFK